MSSPEATGNATEGGDGDVDVDSDSDPDSDLDAYAGVFSAFPYAFRASDSRLFRSYVVLGGSLAALVGVLFGLALITLFGRTFGTPGGTFTFVRAFFLMIGVLTIAPLIAPVLLVARRRRRTGSTARYDAALAATGYLAAFSLYLALVISAPENLREPPRGALAGIVAALYELPRIAGLVPPALASLFIYLVHRRLR